MALRRIGGRPVMLVFLSVMLKLVSSELSCPSKCSCTHNMTVVRCDDKALRAIPQGIPTTVQQLSLRHNLLSELQNSSFSQLRDLEDLDLSQNLLLKIDLQAFAGLNKLKHLYLTQNDLTTLSADIFMNISSLQLLSLSQNKMETIPDLGGNCKNLYKLYLDNNKITQAAFPASFANSVQFTTMVLSNNLITSISADDFKPLVNSNVERISLSRNNLQNVDPHAFEMFPKLKSLTLSYNSQLNTASLKNILTALNSSINLIKLDISGSVQNAIPKDLFRPLSRVPLATLYMSQMNGVGVIVNDTFTPLTKLTNLDLSHSKSLEVIENGAFSPTASSLMRLTLEFNQIRLIPRNLPQSLKTLNLAHNNIMNIPEGALNGLTHLTSLDMSYCRISSVSNDAFISLTNLSSLDLSYNALAGASLGNAVLKPLQQLKFLSLKHNLMTQIPTQKSLLEAQTNLEYLDMSDNECEVLPKEIFFPLTSLKTLDLSGNVLGNFVANADGLIFKSLTNLITLNMEQNTLNDLPSDLLEHVIKLEKLLLSDNMISQWSDGFFNHSRRLTLVDLSLNKIMTVNSSSVDGLPDHVKLNLSGNPFDCWCNLIWFRGWMDEIVNTSRVELVDVSHYICLSPKDMSGKPVLSFNPDDIKTKCFPPPWKFIVIVAASASAGLIVFIVGLMYRYRWPIRLHLYYMRKSCNSKCKTQQPTAGYERLEGSDEAPEYDLLISYGPSERDQNWVKQILVPDIDKELNGQWNIFFEEKMDYNKVFIGVFDEMTRSCRKVMLVISKEYLKDSRREYEITLAMDNLHNRQLRLEDSLIIVLLDDKASVRVPSLLHPIMRANLQLEWTESDTHGQEYFWRQLGEKMQHGQSRRPTAIQA